MNDKVYLTAWQKVVRGTYGKTVTPLRENEEAQFYWCSEISVAEISHAYFEGARANSFIASVGPALLNGASCWECRGPIHVFSRTDAEQSARRDSTRCNQCVAMGNEPFIRAMKRRDERIRALRSMPYRDYLKSPEWQEKREQALKRARYCCQICSTVGSLHVHHRTYVRRGDEYASDLIVLCAVCHETFHQKLTLADGGRAAANWPDKARWPHDVPRPDRSDARETAQ